MTCGTNHVPRATRKYPIFEGLKPTRLHLVSVRVRPLGSHLKKVRVRVKDDCNKATTYGLYIRHDFVHIIRGMSIYVYTVSFVRVKRGVLLCQAYAL